MPRRHWALTAALTALGASTADPWKAATASNCRCGNIDEPVDVVRVHYQDLGKATWECPVAIHGLEDLPHWNELAKYGQVEILEPLAPKFVSFDSSLSGEFAYWDNASALAESVRNAGIVRQGYEKVRAPRKAFFKALQGTATSSGAVRYGGATSGILPKEVRSEVDAMLNRFGVFGDGKNRQSLLWLSSASSYSSAHYDNFHTTFVMLAGEKEFLLSPPGDVAHFHPYPGAHPMARQARQHFSDFCLASRRAVDTSLPSEEVGFPRLARVCTATLRRNEALLLPAGWLHHVTAHSASIALALTTLPREFHDFNKWITQPEEVLPFLKTDSIEWTTGEIAAALLVFVPELLAELDFSTGSTNALDIVFNRSYSPATLAELGIKKDVARQVPPCKIFSTASMDILHHAALQVAARFKAMAKDLQLMYLLPYLETVMSKVAGQETDPAVIMAIATHFAHKCL